MARNYNSQLWEHFNKASDTRTADCNYCGKTLSYKTTITNLKMHLKNKHIRAYESLAAKISSLKHETSIKTENTGQSDEDNDAAAEELLKLSDVWSYFELESGRRASCVVCRKTMCSDYDDLKAHLRENHPKLLLQMMQDKDKDSDAGSNDDENTYTEVVYLEQDSHEDTPKQKEKSKPVSKIMHVTTPKIAKKRISTYDEYHDLPKRYKEAEKKEEDTELGTFIKYITCLLKKLPQDVFSQVQVEIINTILKANAISNSRNSIPVQNDNSSSICNSVITENSSQIVLNNDGQRIGNVITVNDITPSPQYTITVAQKSDENEESS